MSATTVAKMVYRVRLIARDFSKSEPKFYLPEVLDALDRAMFTVHADLPGRSSLNTSFIALVAGDYDYTLSESNPFALEAFRLRSSGQPVYRKTLEQWQNYRLGNPDATGEPIIIAFAEAASGTVTAYVWPTPAESDTLEAVVDTMISSVFQGISDSALSATSLNFGPYGTRAIEHLAAADLLGEDSRGINRERAAYFTHREALRIASLESGDGFLEPVI